MNVTRDATGQFSGSLSFYGPLFFLFVCAYRHLETSFQPILRGLNQLTRDRGISAKTHYYSTRVLSLFNFFQDNVFFYLFMLIDTFYHRLNQSSIKSSWLKSLYSRLSDFSQNLLLQHRSFGAVLLFLGHCFFLFVCVYRHPLTCFETIQHQKLEVYFSLLAIK